MRGARCVFVGEAAGEGGGGLVDFDNPVLQAVLFHRDAVGTEGIGLDAVHADLEERAVDFLDRLWVGDDQVVVTAVEFFAAEVLGG